MTLMSCAQATSLAGCMKLLPSSSPNTEPVPAVDENVPLQERKMFEPEGIPSAETVSLTGHDVQQLWL